MIILYVETREVNDWDFFEYKIKGPFFLSMIIYSFALPVDVSQYIEK